MADKIIGFTRHKTSGGDLCWDIRYTIDVGTNTDKFTICVLEKDMVDPNSFTEAKQLAKPFAVWTKTDRIARKAAEATPVSEDLNEDVTL